MPAGSLASAGMGNSVIKIGSRRENLIDLNNGRNWESYQKTTIPKTLGPYGALEVKKIYPSWRRKILSQMMDSEACEKSPIMTSSKQDISPHICMLVKGSIICVAAVHAVQLSTM